jgi:dihydrofolate synthase/folylpolyglutamate synthase
MNTILNAVKMLKDNGLDISDCTKALDNIVESTGLVGRWMEVNKNPRAVCDTGHNVGGWQYLSKQIKAQKCNKLRIVFGMVDDKDIDSVMDMLPQNAIYYWTQTKNKRAIPVETVAQKASIHHLSGNVYNNVKEAYQNALSESGKDDFIFIGGSSYIVADLLS